MSFGRTAAAILTVAVSLLFGLVKKSRISKESLSTAELISDLKFIEGRIETEKRPIIEILFALSKQGNYREYWSRVLIGLNDGKGIEQAIVNAGMPEICEEAKRVIQAHTAGLSADGLRSMIIELEKLRSDIVKRNAERERLTGVLSVLAGLSVALLLI